jgi:DNA polymerase III delta subunit
MITLLVGDNSFEVERALSVIIDEFDGAVERIDGSELQLSQLPDILMGVSLFADKRLVVIKNLSDNKSVWPVFGDWITKVSSDIHLVIVEPKPDKRTSTYKALKESVDVREYSSWGERDFQKAEKWLTEEAKKLGLDLNKKSIQLLVNRVGLDQWRLFHALDKLSLTDDISEESIKNIIESDPVESVFNLFETAIRGDLDELVSMLHNLEKTEDVYRLTSLLMSQVFQLAAVMSADKSDNVVKDFGIHPYVVSKLTSVARELGKNKVVKVISIFTELDDDMKTSVAEPWLLVERALMKAASI